MSQLLINGYLKQLDIIKEKTQRPAIREKFDTYLIASPITRKSDRLARTRNHCEREIVRITQAVKQAAR